ncbi:class I SAM-dependent methyltransferase [Methanosarcina sp.]|uniref:class I SAM-dependent methyltransferase n=1 Tax=Methanosarcina sp. TaxID=2213 RepID=UPI00298967C1|nr:methyltransferase domain-containing protein [Methanosarcina sp.]MDW5549737.1 methyltransferase domain-containing protein [Methanosarcina sp.]MDW5555635.1 methyltransferase domain-containing protein [Methanosarcina sp.]MDW5561175.1 methyltransferase domain-containing protein [Methanosarcina sp.]
MRVFTTILLKILGFFVLLQITIRIIKRFYAFSPPAFMGFLLDSDFRKKLQPPDKLIKRSGIKEGMRILEVGCGSGAFTIFAARVCGIKGEVYALDIQPRMLMQLKKKLSRPENRDIKNIKLVEGDAYKLPFNDNSFDVVYTVTVLQELPDQNRALKEMKRVLKPGGILAVSEFLPDPDYPLKSTTIRLGEKAGFIQDKVEGNLWNYTVRFKAQKTM